MSSFRPEVFSQEMISKPSEIKKDVLNINEIPGPKYNRMDNPQKRTELNHPSSASSNG